MEKKEEKSKYIEVETDDFVPWFGSYIWRLSDRGVWEKLGSKNLKICLFTFC